LLTVDLPVEGGKSKEASREGGEGDAIDVIKDLYTVAGLKDVATVISKKGSFDSLGLFTHFSRNFYFLLDILLQYGLGIDKIGLVILFKDPNAFCII
jgi:hypothetical protein